jgi:heptosyltransferase III
VPRILECLPRDSRVAIIRLRSLGDCVLTTPALDILKRHRPDLRLAIVAEDRFREIFEGNPDIDEILAPELTALRRFAPKLCLNFHGGTRSAWMTSMSGAHYRVAFGHFRQSWAYNVSIPRAQEILGVERKVHTAEHLASAIFFLGAPETGIPRAKLSGSPGRNACATSAAVIHPVASTPEKTWPAENFLTIAAHLKQTGIEPVFIGGPGDDLSPFRAHRTIAGAPLSQIKSLLASASMFVGNDSGPAHMAAAFGLPVVVIFGSSDPEIWGPWRTTGAALSAPGGIGGVTVAQVIDAVERVRVHA